MEQVQQRIDKSDNNIRLLNKRINELNLDEINNKLKQIPEKATKNALDQFVV